MYRTAIFFTELFGVINVLIILYGTIFETRQASRKRSAFIKLCVGNLVAVLADALSWLPFTDSTGWILYCITVIAFLAPYYVNAAFIDFFHVSISKKTDIPDIYFQVGTVLSIVVGTICTLEILMGNMFTVVDGKYYDGPHYDIYLVGYALVFVYIIILISVNIRKMGIHDSIAAILFILIPIVFITLNLVNPEWTFSIASLPIDLLVMYIMLHRDYENTLHAREQATRILAHRDELTGLLNRLAFTEACEKCEKTPSLGVLFCDLNGLKYTNDNFGHKAGDKLLCDFANIARESFDEKFIFRISGDEFVIFVPSTSKKMFENKYKAVVDKINSLEWPIASIGTSFGSGTDISELISEAETKMYEDKAIFREKHPLFSR